MASFVPANLKDRVISMVNVTAVMHAFGHSILKYVFLHKFLFMGLF